MARRRRSVRRANVSYTGDMDLSVLVERVRPLVDQEV
ncbi:hypothetical protein ABIC22_000001, partial [Paenibacillus sp. PvP094]